MTKQSEQSGAGNQAAKPMKKKKATRLDHSREVIGYVTQWDAWKDGGGYTLKGAFNNLNVDYSRYTILNFSFFGVATDGSLHSGDHRNKEIWKENESQLPKEMVHGDPFSSWDQAILYGEMLPAIYWINQGDYASSLGYRNNSTNLGWEHPESGRSGLWPLILPDPNGKKGLIEQAHENEVLVMASLGGWSMSRHFPEMALDVTKRNRFLDDCEKLIEMGFDGIDIDWEYPNAFGMNIWTCDPQDYESFADLMEVLRDRIGPDKLITAAMSAAPENLEGFDWQRLNRSMNYFNMMTYDFNGGWSDIAGHNSPLYDYTGAERQNRSVNACVQALKSYNTDMRKVNIGVGFYGRGVITAGPAELNGPTVKRDVVIDPDGPMETCADYDNWGDRISTLDFAGTPNYGYIRHVTDGDNGWQKHWDPEARVPYMTKGSYFLSYDDECSIREKAKYIKEHNLAGVIVWQVWGDMMNMTTNTEEVQGDVGQKRIICHDRTTPLIEALNDELSQESGDPTGIILDSPQGGNVFQAPAPIPVRIEANQVLAGRSVTSIRIFDVHEDGETKEVHSENNPTFPLDWSWTDPKLGLHLGLYAVAILSDGTPLRTDNGDPANRPRFRYQPAGN